MEAVLWAVGRFRQHLLTMVLPSVALGPLPIQVIFASFPYIVPLSSKIQEDCCEKSPLMFVPFTASCSQVGGSMA